MKAGLGACTSVIVVVLLALALAGPARAAGVTNLGSFVPAGLNAADQVVGDIPDPSPDTSNGHAALWSDGVLTRLPEQPGATKSDAFAISAGGRIVGDNYVPVVPTPYGSNEVHALYWDGVTAPTQVEPLDTVPGRDYSQALAVDAAGDVVGLADQVGGFLYHGGVLSPVGHGEGAGGGTTVGAITADGSRLLGTYSDLVSFGYYLWSGSAPDAPGTKLDLTPETGVFSSLSGAGSVNGLVMNDLAGDGAVIGFKDSGGTPNVRTHYLRLPGGTEILIATGPASLNAVNAQHVVAGAIPVGAIPHAATWQDGTFTDLNTLLPPNSGLVLTEATAINDAGDVAGVAVSTTTGDQVGFLLERSSTLTISAVTIAPDPPQVSDDPITVSITVRNGTSDTVTGVSAGLTSNTPDVVTVSQAPAPASVASLGPGASTTFTAKLHPVGGGKASLSVTASGTDGSSPLTATPRTRTFTVAQLSGTVTDTKSKPVAGATVNVTGTETGGGAVATSAVTGADGVYHLGLAPGSYDFDVRGGPTPTGQAGGGTWTTKACAGPGPAPPGTCHLDVASDTTPLPGFGYILPDLQAENVEISQGIQSEIWDDAGGAYTGVPLVRDVPTVARVYASVVADGTPPDVPAVPAELHGYTASGTELAGSPITATTRTLQAGPSLPAARTQAAGAYTFTLPPAWTEAGPIKLTADVDPKAGDARPIHECRGCDGNDTFSLSPVAFATVAPLTIRPFAITYRYRLPDLSGDFVPQTPPDLSGQFDRARDVLPIPTGGLDVQKFPQATIDITPQVSRVLHFWRAHNHVLLDKPDLSDCMTFPNCRNDLQIYELAAIHRSITLTHDARTFLYGFEPIPDGVTQASRGISIAGPSRRPRALTTTAHEFMHLLGIHHASPCGGGGADGQIAADWPPDQKGYIQGVGLDRRPDSGGTGLHKIIAPGVGNDQWYDLMSYCAQTDDSDAWISTINWTKFVHEGSTQARSAARATGPRLAVGASTRARARRAAAATGPRLAVDASIRNGKVTLLGAGEIDGAATASRTSAYHFKALGTGGRVIADIGVVPEALDDSPAVLLSANLPVKGVTAVQVVKGGRVVATERKPTPGPSVTLAAPRRKGGELTLRWKAHGARGAALTSTIQVRTKAGWQTLIAGLTTTRYTAKVPRSTAVRIAVNDGFTTVVSNARKR